MRLLLRFGYTPSLWGIHFCQPRQCLTSTRTSWVSRVGAQCCAVFCVFAYGFSATMMLTVLESWGIEMRTATRRPDWGSHGNRALSRGTLPSVLSRGLSPFLVSLSLSPKLCDDSVRRMCILVDRKSFCLLPFPFTSRLDDHTDWATSSINLQGHSSAYVQEAAHPRCTEEAVTTQHWGWTHWKHSSHSQKKQTLPALHNKTHSCKNYNTEIVCFVPLQDNQEVEIIVILFHQQ